MSNKLYFNILLIISSTKLSVLICSLNSSYFIKIIILRDYLFQLNMNSKQIQEDIKKFKVKEGMIWKRSRYLRQWRQRWIVLTENYLYSFDKKQVYTNPTQQLNLTEIQTLKSYFKLQQERENSFRAQAKSINFYLATNTAQQKWAWILSIQKMIERKVNKVQSNLEIKQTVNRATFVRQSFRTTYKPQNNLMNLQQNNRISSNRVSFVNNLWMKKTKKFSVYYLEPVNIKPAEQHKNYILPKPKQIKIQYFQMSPIKIQSNIQNLKQKQPISNLPNKQISEQVQQQALSLAEKMQRLQKKQQYIQDQLQPIKQNNKLIVEKIVQKIVQKIIIKTEFIEIKVPEVHTIEKIVYVESNQLKEENQDVICQLFDQILISQTQIRFFLNFIVKLSLLPELKLQQKIINNCLFHQNARFFSESFLTQFNRQTDDTNINESVKFLILVYEKTDEFFYISDLKVLVDILIRQLETYRSQLNHYLILELLRSLVLKQNWITMQGYRVSDLQNLIQEIKNMSPSIENQEIAKEILNYI